MGVALVVGAGAAAGFALSEHKGSRSPGSGASGPGPSAPSSTLALPTTSTQPAPATTTASSPPAPAALIDQAQAKAAVRRAASSAAKRQGFVLGPADFDARCTAVGGTDRAPSWRCEAASADGRCHGTLAVYAARPGVAATRDEHITCA